MESVEKLLFVYVGVGVGGGRLMILKSGSWRRKSNASVFQFTSEKELLRPPTLECVRKPSQRRHDVSVAVVCHSTSHAMATALKRQPVDDANEP